MPFIAFLGCDGSGKSSVIKALTKHLSEKGFQVTEGHWRPKFPFQGRADRCTNKVADPHHRPPRGILGSGAKLAWNWLVWWAGWFAGLRRASSGGFLVFDRYHADMIVDPRRYRYGGPLWLARLASRASPRPDVIFYLDASVPVLLSRKQEVERAALDSARHEYLCLCRSNERCRVIDASQPLELVIADVIRETERIGRGLE